MDDGAEEREAQPARHISTHLEKHDLSSIDVLLHSKCRRISDVAASPKPKDHFFRPCCVTYSSPTRVESFITEVKRANIRMAATA